MVAEGEPPGLTFPTAAVPHRHEAAAAEVLVSDLSTNTPWSHRKAAYELLVDTHGASRRDSEAVGERQARRRRAKAKEAASMAATETTRAAVLAYFAK